MDKQNLTLLDIKLARIYFPMLMELAANKHTLTYGEFVAEAKKRHPNLDYVQKAFPLSIGRRLNAVYYFTHERGYPDLSALLINKEKGELENELEDRKAAYGFDWSKVDVNFDLYSDELVKIITPRKTRSREEAKKLMVDYFRKNLADLNSGIRKYREEIISHLREGLEVEEVFSIFK